MEDGSQHLRCTQQRWPMPDFDRQEKLWSQFLEAWPPSRVKQMRLDEYTNPSKEDAFIYWIEKRLDKLGGIGGGSAFKFGIYCRDNTEAKEATAGRNWGEKYAWLSKFGQTEQAAFATIRARLAEVVDAAIEGNLERIESVNLSPTLKWKVAFLYQDRSHPAIFPIFKKEALFHNYLEIDPRAKLSATPYHVMYAALLERNSSVGDILQIADFLWKKFQEEQAKTPRAWAVPLSWTLRNSESIENLCRKTRVEPEDIEPPLDELLSKADLAEGDFIALLVDGDVRALGTISNAESGQFSWEQQPVNFPSPLLVNPAAEIKQIEPTEQAQIWKESGELRHKADQSASLIEPSPPCDPQNIILYGPPGTGKTYSTIRRALELVLGRDQLDRLGDKVLPTIFREHQARGQIEFVTFHQAYGYEEFIEGLRPVLGESKKEVQYEIHNGVFKRIALRAAAEGLTSSENEIGDVPQEMDSRVQMALNKPTPGRADFSFSARSRQYVLIIDEINRGNISKILGELITLLDPDKRLGTNNELKLPLSYSPSNRFAVPPNLHVIGTMNTADRSIALMDVALRRRFKFEELMPDSNVIAQQLLKSVSDLAFVELVVDIFETLNNRIRFLYDRDHQLGHSYFLEVSDIESLRVVFLTRLIPLLQEYFYGSWPKITMVLGCPYDEIGDPSRRSAHLLDTRANSYSSPMIVAQRFEELSTLGFDHDDFEDRIDYLVNPDFQSGALERTALVRTFLNILELSSESHNARLDRLCTEVPVTK